MRRFELNLRTDSQQADLHLVLVVLPEAYNRISKMPYNPDLHHRRSIRLKNHDYSQPGAYFITLCTQDRECWFGNLVDGSLDLSAEGRIIQQYWQHLPYHFPPVILDAAVIMPNHFHGVVVISEQNSDAASVTLQKKPVKLCQIVAYFKYHTTKVINQLHDTAGRRIWQRNYYEHIIRSEQSLQVLREYVATNPLKWDMDQLNPKFSRSV